MKIAPYAFSLLALGGLAVTNSLGLTSDPDVFWHLRTAETALETRSWLPRDVFSYSAFGAPWVYKDLVAEVALYLGFARFGFGWFAALKVVTAAAMVLATYVAVRPRDRSPLALLAGAGLMIDAFWLVERPNLFSIAFFALALACVERARRSAAEQRPRAIAYALVPVVGINLVWTWVHRFAALGHLLLFGLAALLVFARVVHARPSARRLLGPCPSLRFVAATALAAVASPLVALLNPSGTFAFTSSFTMAMHPELRAQFFEWKRATLPELFGAFPIATALALAAAVALGARLLVAFRASREGGEDAPVTLWHAAILLALACMTADSVRWVPYLAIASALVLSSILGERLARATGGVPRGASILAALLLFGLLRVRQNDAPLAVGEDPAWSPRGAVDFAAAHGLRGRVVNAFDFGGYLIWRSWPEVQVLVDGRSELVYPPSFVERALLAEHDAPTFAAMRAEDGASWVLALNTGEQVGTGFLARDPAWWLVYWSDTAAVYVRRDAHPELGAESFRFVDPFDVPGSVAAALARVGNDAAGRVAVLAEVRRMLSASPDSVRANLALVAVLEALGPPGRAERDAVLDRLLVLTGGAPSVIALARSLHTK